MRAAIVERDEKVLEELKKGLKRVDPNYELAGIAGNGQSAYEMITVMQPNLVIMDIGLPRMNGLNLLRKLRTEGREFRVIIITKDEDFQQAKQAIDLGVDGYLVQPFRPMELKKALSRIHEKIRNEYWMQASFTVENVLLSCRYGEIISNQKLNEMTIRKYGFTVDDPGYLFTVATVYKGNIIKNLIMDCQSYTKYRPNETTGGIFVSWRRKEELPTGA